MKSLILSLGIVLLGSPALAQFPGPQTGPEQTLTIEQNNTGGRPDVIVSRGSTGADTITNNSAAGGNASRPELRIPNGSANGGGAGGR